MSHALDSIDSTRGFALFGVYVMMLLVGRVLAGSDLAATDDILVGLPLAFVAQWAEAGQRKRLSFVATIVTLVVGLAIGVFA